MNIRRAQPLPDCLLCEQPTSRRAWLANAGLCSGCTEGISDTVRMVRLPPAPDQFGDHTVVVEGYRPPVPERVRQLVEDGVVDPAVADEFAAQVARDLDEMR